MGPPPGKERIKICRDADEVALEASLLLCRVGRQAISERGTAHIALSGGSTPSAMYRLIAGAAHDPPWTGFPWEKVFWYWGDERFVAPVSDQSNYRLAQDELLSKLPVPAKNVFRMQGETPDPGAAALAYGRILRANLPSDDRGFPVLDLIFLGLGTDGHTASLFPGTDILTSIDVSVGAPWVKKLGSHRLSLTPGTLNAGREVAFLVSGSGKAEMLKKVMEGSHQPDQYPAQLIRPLSGFLHWLLDEEAAALLARRS